MTRTIMASCVRRAATRATAGAHDGVADAAARSAGPVEDIRVRLDRTPGRSLMGAVAAPRTTRSHRAFTAWVAILAVAVGVLFVAVTLLTLAVWIADPTGAETDPVVDLGFFALGGVLAAGGLAVQLRRPERHVAGLWQAAVALAALAVMGWLSDRVEPTWGGLVLLAGVGVAAAAHPARGASTIPGPVALPLAALAAVAALPAAAYGVAMLTHARAAGPSCFAGQCAGGDRYAEVAALGVAIVVVTAMAALRPAGWRLAAASAAVAAGLLGAASMVLPDVPASLGTVGGAAAVAWGAAVAWTARVVDRPGGGR